MQESIIVYRNPMEKAMWESTSSADGFPIIAGMVVCIVFFLVAFALIEKFVAWRLRDTFNKVALVVGVLLWLATIIIL